MYEEDTTLQDILGGTAAAGVGGTATAAAIVAERARRLKNSQKDLTYRDALFQVGNDIADDMTEARRVIIGDTDYDRAESGANKSEKPKQASFRDYAQSLDADNIYSVKPTGSSYVKNPLTQAAIAARDAFGPSSEDFLGFRRAERLDRGVSPEGPKSDTVFSRIPSLDAIRDLLPANTPGGFTDEEIQHRKKIGIDLMKANSAQAAGGLLGRTASDFVNNGVRSLWWLLNAPQAVADVAAEGLSSVANREGLYGLDYALESEAKNRGWIDADDKPKNSSINPVKYDFSVLEKNDPQLARRVKDLQAAGQTGQRVFSKRRVGANLSTLLAAPAAVAINTGLGLNNFFGGGDGRKAVFPDEQDPQKSSNALAEVAAKYILGRQGDLLPWDEYKQVRPDVTKDEYRAYKAYKFNKQADYNIFDDGDINILNGIIKTNDDGVDGGELMFLGRSMPYATTIAPTVAGVGGAALGAALSKYGGLNLDGVEEGIARRETQSENLGRQVNAMSEDERSAPAAQKKLDQMKRLEKEIAGKKKMKNFMETGPMSAVFKNPTIRKTGVVRGGLLAGLAAAGVSQLIGSEAERRRRAYEAEQGI